MYPERLTYYTAYCLIIFSVLQRVPLISFQKVELMDVVGRILFSEEQVNAHTFRMTDTNLPSGIYYVRVFQRNEKVKTGKLL